MNKPIFNNYFMVIEQLEMITLEHLFKPKEGNAPSRYHALSKFRYEYSCNPLTILNIYFKESRDMNKSILTLVGSAILTGTFIAPSIVYGDDSYKKEEYKKDEYGKNKPDEDNIACYSWDIFPGERLKLDVKNHSPLTDKGEVYNFGHAKQTAFSVHGKHVVGESMAAAEGTVITADKIHYTTGQTGAHLGLIAKWVRGDGTNDFARSVTWDCTTDEISSTPGVWNCESRNEFDVYHGFSKLYKVDAAKDPSCSVFEDGLPETRQLTAEALAAPASFKDKPVVNHKKPHKNNKKMRYGY